ncbi:Planctomycete cytochrome C [Caulifigura coniformis]|uniref:Planctomycete cytochrome C n=1 Tax=Caulifigura coniformis TaxID=2527983 RepID=A0A517SAG3_9PLAN|nr:PSD1 and planctomycete cytochrome C domain-containing protein [Caulifigura coniformis]QDT53125.1 Planctomycete cytochrome C [Caulifigura coniformis]
MRFASYTLLLLMSGSFGGAIGFSAESVAADPDREKSFEAHVRPLLVKRCGNCHGPEKQQGDLRLDLKPSVLGEKPGEGVVVPGKPDESRLLEVIRYTAGETQMPPAGKLPAVEIDILTNWIKDGAYWPDHGPATGTKTSAGLPKSADGQWDFAAIATSHWAFAPPAKPALPEIKDAGRVQRPMDRFVIKQLEAAGLSLSPPVDRRTLAKRAWFDLVGVPPTYEEVEAFANDPAPDAFEKLVDHLLALPQYGERWGRHWLDVARYADTKGYVFTENRFYPFSFTYRDYVIQSFNNDKPYDQFILEQLAADQLGKPAGDESLAALGFLTVGRRYLNNQQDIIDDRIDVVSRGLLGLSVSCARCHDHKFDPIPTADYYSLYGVFASCSEPEDLPLIGEPVDSPEYQAYREEFVKRQKACDDYEARVYVELKDHLRTRAGDYMQAILKEEKKLPEGVSLSYKDGEPADRLIAHWKQHLGRVKQDHPVLGLWKRLVDAPAAEFSKRLATELAEATPPLNPRVKTALASAPPQNIVELAKAYGTLFAAIDAEWTAATKDVPSPPAQLGDADSEDVRRVLYGEASVTSFPQSDTKRLFGRNHRDHLKELEKKLAQLNVDSPGAPPRAMVVQDNPSPTEPVIFVRGNAGRRGEKVPRRFPRILNHAGAAFQKGSGRLELAKAIVDPANPLTARVMVNRVWMLHFGTPLVASPSDFGVRADAPTNPELLDYLADFFVKSGWSIKELHREMLLSATWQQQSLDRPDARAVDSENSLYWRMNRRRREFESLRDSWLAAAGKLDPRMFGRPVNIETQPYTGRRTIYELVDRNNLPGLLRTFDFPTPDSSSAQRPQTTVPQQALYGMNSPFIQELAAALADRPRASDNPDTRATQLFRYALGRDPLPDESRALTEAVSAGAFDWPEAAQVLLLSNEFAFVD